MTPTLRRRILESHPETAHRDTTCPDSSHSDSDSSASSRNQAHSHSDLPNTNNPKPSQNQPRQVSASNSQLFLYGLILLFKFALFILLHQLFMHYIWTPWMNPGIANQREQYISQIKSQVCGVDGCDPKTISSISKVVDEIVK